MHILQPKHSRISEKETEEILKKFNISKAQLPKILSTDPALPEGCNVGDIVQVQRKDGENVFISHRVVI
jgi:DNA-directed RNA polymerase subunit H